MENDQDIEYDTMKSGIILGLVCASLMSIIISYVNERNNLNQTPDGYVNISETERNYEILKIGSANLVYLLDVETHSFYERVKIDCIEFTPSDINTIKKFTEITYKNNDGDYKKVIKRACDK